MTQEKPTEKDIKRLEKARSLQGKYHFIDVELRRYQDGKIIRNNGDKSAKIVYIYTCKTCGRTVKARRPRKSDFEGNAICFSCREYLARQKYLAKLERKKAEEYKAIFERGYAQAIADMENAR